MNQVEIHPAKEEAEEDREEQGEGGGRDAGGGGGGGCPGLDLTRALAPSASSSSVPKRKVDGCISSADPRLHDLLDEKGMGWREENAAS